jgi:hypothetical protein
MGMLHFANQTPVESGLIFIDLCSPSPRYRKDNLEIVVALLGPIAVPVAAVINL